METRLKRKSNAGPRVCIITWPMLSQLATVLKGLWRCFPNKQPPEVSYGDVLYEKAAHKNFAIFIGKKRIPWPFTPGLNLEGGSKLYTKDSNDSYLLLWFYSTRCCNRLKFQHMKCLCPLHKIRYVVFSLQIGWTLS